MSDCVCNRCGGRGTTLNNILHAYCEELTASARYAAYALRAREDGYLGVAALFEAIAVSEKIHAGRHAKVAMFLGAKAQATIAKQTPMDVPAMLQFVIGDERNECDSLYPKFIEEAKKENIGMAVVSFHGSMMTEETHAQLCQEAFDHLEEWRKPRTFYVCAMCGWTTEGPRPSSCPVCTNPDSGFLEY